jgi:hypothetical protein
MGGSGRAGVRRRWPCVRGCRRCTRVGSLPGPVILANWPPPRMPRWGRPVLKVGCDMGRHSGYKRRGVNYFQLYTSWQLTLMASSLLSRDCSEVRRAPSRRENHDLYGKNDTCLTCSVKGGLVKGRFVSLCFAARSVLRSAVEVSGWIVARAKVSACGSRYAGEHELQSGVVSGMEGPRSSVGRARPW